MAQQKNETTVKFGQMVMTTEDLKDMPVSDFAKHILGIEVQKWQEDFLLKTFAGSTPPKFIRSPKSYSKSFISNTPKDTAGVRGLKHTLAIIDDPIGRPPLTYESLKDASGLLDHNILGDPIKENLIFKIMPTLSDYDKIRMTWWERFKSFKWFTKYKEVYNPKIIKANGYIYCSHKTKAEIMRSLSAENAENKSQYNTFP